MDKLEELKKLKQLLDEGIITEEDFKQQKSKLLGLSNDAITAEKNEEIIEKDTRGKTKSLEDYEKELLEQSNQEKDSKEEKIKQNDDIYEKEKLKIKAKLDAEEEIRIKRRTEQKMVVAKGVNKFKRILKWTLATCLWLIGIASVSMVSDGIINLIVGIIILLLGCMACPKITDYTQKHETYTKHKTLFVWILVILTFVLICSFPTEPDDVNDDTTNEMNIIE